MQLQAPCELFSEKQLSPANSKALVAVLSWANIVAGFEQFSSECASNAAALAFATIALQDEQLSQLAAKLELKSGKRAEEAGSKVLDWIFEISAEEWENTMHLKRLWPVFALVARRRNWEMKMERMAIDSSN